jgi:hypothetical protein
MSLLVVIAITAVVVVYVRTSRKQRTLWLQKLDLLGCWQWDSGDETLTLAGEPDGGTFARAQGDETVRGEWRLVGHDMHLTVHGRTDGYDLRLFRPGCIGLEDTSGQGRIYEKAGANVVSLDQARR